jgi:hypothetical protein
MHILMHIMGFWPVLGPCQRLKLNGIRGNPRVEARVGIERIPPSTSHSKSTAYGAADLLNLKRLHFMSRITLPYYF